MQNTFDQFSDNIRAGKLWAPLYYLLPKVILFYSKVTSLIIKNL